ncbi:hypothetical protein GINT2_000159 [Glugoides intestinalis]
MPETYKGLLNKIPLTSIEELTKSTEKNFIIKIGAHYCRPCQNLDAFLTNKGYSAPCNISIYTIELDGPNKGLLSELPKELRSKSIPYCCVTNSSLEKIDSITGYNRESFIEFIEKNFGSGNV